MHNALLVLLVLLIVLSLGGLAALALYWYIFRRPWARHEGTQQVTGLTAPVDVLRDSWGVPHVYAASETDALFAQGFVHAQDRLWQMEMQRRIVAGRLAELFGRATLELDRFVRTLGLRQAAEADLAALDAETVALLDAYARGVNAGIAACDGRFPAEFTLLGTRPAPWTATDSLGWAKLIGWMLSGNWESELVRLQIIASVGPHRAADLEPNYPRDHPTLIEPSLHARDAAAMLLAYYEALKGWLGPTGSPVGSNSWAVGGSKTNTGQPFLASDPHLGVLMPGLWYTNHLTGGELEVSGVSFPGVPWVVIGHNRHVSWGLTAAMVDNTDLYMERIDPTQPDRYEYDGHWEPLHARSETIQVKGEAEPVMLTVRATHHGPIVSDVVNSPVPLALRWTGHQATATARAVRRLNHAHRGADVDDALHDWAIPAMNVTWADTHGDIGYALAGHVPVRQQGLGAVPVAGWDAAYEWQDAPLAASELPRLWNPDDGLIVSANHRIVGDEYPHFLTLEWSPGFRAQRILEVLKVRRRVTLSDCRALQLDTTSLLAQEMVPYFTALEPNDHFERVAVRLLRDWDTRMEPTSAGAAVFELALLHLLHLLFGDKLGDTGRRFLGDSSSPLYPANSLSVRAVLRALELLAQERSIWFDDAQTGRPRSRDEVLAEALRRAVATLRQTIGDDSRRWQWGRLHQVQFTHPVGTVRLLRRFFNRGPFPLGGGTETVMAAAYPLHLPIGTVNVIPSCRLIFDLADWDRCLAVHTTGQSGQPGHRHYADQMMMWREGEYHPLLWTRARVEERTTARLRLEPG